MIPTPMLCQCSYALLFARDSVKTDFAVQLCDFAVDTVTQPLIWGYPVLFHGEIA